MKDKQIIIVLLVFVFFPLTTLFSQRNGLIGGKKENIGALVLTAGPSYCFGDLGGSTKANATAMDNINLENVRYVFSLGFRQSFNNKLAYRLSFHQGLYESTDKGSSKDNRGYESSSNIIKFTALGEFSVFQGFINSQPWRIYIYGGGGLAYASVDLKGSPVRAPNLSETSEFTPVIPFGFGFDVWANSNLSLGLEVGWQYAFSDYLDGVQTGGANRNNDILANVSFTLSYRIFSGARSKNKCNCM